MSKEESKFNFFKKLKDTILNKDGKTLDEDSVLREIPIKTVTAIQEEVIIEPYINVSKSNYLDEVFAENFIHSGGKFIYCEDENSFIETLSYLKGQKKWNHIFSWNESLLNFFRTKDFQRLNNDFSLNQSDVAISYCYQISANEGVIVLSPEQATNRRLVNFPSTHIIIAYKNNLKPNIKQAIYGFDKLYGGRIASILELHKNKPVLKEHHKILLKADGPTDVYLFYIDEEKLD